MWPVQNSQFTLMYSLNKPLVGPNEAVAALKTIYFTCQLRGRWGAVWTWSSTFWWCWARHSSCSGHPPSSIRGTHAPAPDPAPPHRSSHTYSMTSFTQLEAEPNPNFSEPDLRKQTTHWSLYSWPVQTCPPALWSYPELVGSLRYCHQCRSPSPDCWERDHTEGTDAWTPSCHPHKGSCSAPESCETRSTLPWHPAHVPWGDGACLPDQPCPPCQPEGKFW